MTFSIAPTLRSALVPSVMEKTSTSIVGVVPASDDLLQCFGLPFGMIERLPIDGHKRRCHVDAIEPHLMGIDKFVPIASVASLWMVLELLDELHLHAFLILLQLLFGNLLATHETGILFNQVIDFANHPTSTNQVEVVGLHRALLDCAIVHTERVAPFLGILEVTTIARLAIEVEIGGAAHALGVAKEGHTAIIVEVKVWKSLEFALGKLNSHIPGGVDEVHGAFDLLLGISRADEGQDCENKQQESFHVWMVFYGLI